MKIISIDPGYERLGLAILEKTPASRQEKILYSDCFQTSAQFPFEGRLKLIGQEIKKIIKKYRPAVLVMETVFFNTNQKTAFLVAEVKGLLKYIALENKLEIFEYTPLQIKIAITGYGRSSKQQMLAMLTKLIQIEKKIKYDDEYDALAVGLTYFAINPVRE